jgi:hypothetical protein
MTLEDEFAAGDAVTRRWYEPGEPYRPLGNVVAAAESDLARLKAIGADPAKWVLVHWRTGNAREWERREDLRHDEAQA